LYDPQTKLVRFGARDYDPTLGRWTAKDPVVHTSEPQLNLYSYAGLMPTFMVDPDGGMIIPESTPYWVPDFFCAYKAAREASGRFGPIPPVAGKLAWNDKFQHCLVSCIIARECGLVGAFGAGAGKEVMDAWNKLRGRKATPSWYDFKADVDGILCAMSARMCQDCFCCCAQKHQPFGRE
jgi:RHS repeat-associated protein